MIDFFSVRHSYPGPSGHTTYNQTEHAHQSRTTFVSRDAQKTTSYIVPVIDDLNHRCDGKMAIRTEKCLKLIALLK